MIERLQRYVVAFLALAGFVGAVSTIAGVIKGSLVYLLNTLGYIGLLGSAIGYMVFLFVFAGRSRYDLYLGLATGAAIATVLRFTYFGGSEDGNHFNVASALGIAYAVGVFMLGVNLYDDVRRRRARPMKKCPDCANDVFAEARVCEHCNYRFDKDLPHDS